MAPGCALLERTPEVPVWLTAELDLAASLAAFREARRASLDFLRGLTPEHLLREGIHGDRGPVTLGNLLHEWPLHDLGHVRQIAELVRARRFHPHLGPWQPQYPLKP